MGYTRTIMKAILLGLLSLAVTVTEAKGLLGQPVSDMQQQSDHQLRGPKGSSVPVPRKLNNRQRKRMPQKGLTRGYIDELLNDELYDYTSPDSTIRNKSKKNRGKKRKNTKSKWNGVGPRVGDVAFLDDEFFDDGFFDSDDDCELVGLNETFSMNGADLFLAPDTTITSPGDPKLPGSVFIFENQPILEPDGSAEINGTMVSGTCTRTTMGDAAGGICQFVFVDDAGFSITVSGSVFGMGGPMAIAGGTGGMVGVTGEMDFKAVFRNTATTTDIFIDAERYQVMVQLGLIVCPEQNQA